MGRVTATFVACFAVIFPSAGLMPAWAGDDADMMASIVRGGRLYDNWYAETRERPPMTSHPAYPKQGEFSDDPKSNWQCVECHGWDYKGRDGAYAAGPHATGIVGIRQMSGADPQKIVTVLKNETHAYGGLLSESSLLDLAYFVSAGQVDTDDYIDPQSRTAKGTAETHRDHYNSICANCHGKDGAKIPTMPKLGEVARSNPWEALHKMLNGHPAEKMPALRVLDRQVLVDVLAYAQQLPGTELEMSILRGGRLYDNWRKEIGDHAGTLAPADHPAVNRHPSYPIEASYRDDPQTNWRCKECHGWDYKGKDGAYGNGRHFTGIKGIAAFSKADTENILTVLTDEKHGYSMVLSRQDLLDLANFVGKGQIDMDFYIDPATGMAKGDNEKRKSYYTTICATCHGVQGTAIVTMDTLGRVARNNPWAALHTMIYGHPDEAMPALRVEGLGVLTDVLAYIQTLPDSK